MQKKQLEAQEDFSFPKVANLKLQATQECKTLQTTDRVKNAKLGVVSQLYTIGI